MWMWMGLLSLGFICIHSVLDYSLAQFIKYYVILCLPLIGWCIWSAFIRRAWMIGCSGSLPSGTIIPQCLPIIKEGLCHAAVWRFNNPAGVPKNLQDPERRTRRPHRPARFVCLLLTWRPPRPFDRMKAGLRE